MGSGGRGGRGVSVPVCRSVSPALARGAGGEPCPPLRPCPPPSLAELARMYKNEGNEYFRERDYGRAVVAYTEGLKKKCEDPELNAVLHTNRGAAQFYLGKETCPVPPRTGLGRGLLPV